MRQSSLHPGRFQRARQLQTEALEQDRLVLSRATHAALPNRHSASCRQEYVDQRYLSQFLKHLSRFIPQPGAMTELRQGLPQNVG